MKRRSLTAALLLMLSAGFAFAQNPSCPRPDCPRQGQGNCPRNGNGNGNGNGACARARRDAQQSGSTTQQPNRPRGAMRGAQR